MLQFTLSNSVAKQPYDLSLSLLAENEKKEADEEIVLSSYPFLSFLVETSLELKLFLLLLLLIFFS